MSFKRWLFAVIVLLSSEVGFTQTHFLTLPLLQNNPEIVHGWNYNGGTTHYSIDYRTTLDQPVVSAADGVAISTYSPADQGFGAYGNFILVRHNEVDGQGRHYMSIYAHLNSTASHIVDRERFDTNYGTWTPVKRGEIVGYAGQSGTGWIHLHFEVFLGDYANKASNRVDSYDIYEKGYLYPPNGPTGPNHLFLDNIPVIAVGRYNQGWLPINHSQSFVDAYLADGTLGRPIDNGGGAFVHWWSDAGQYPLVGVWIQDFHNPTTNRYSALIRNPNGNVYAVKGPFRDWYTDPAHFGYKELGAPKGKEQQESSNIVQEFENGALTRPVASSTVSQEYLVRLAVNNMYAPVQLSATNFTQTSITLAWKDGVNPSGTTYKIYRNNAYVVSSGTNLYFSDSGLSPNTMYQYKVSALYNNEESIFSNTVIVGTLPSEPSGQTGYLTLVSDPSGAGIYRDGAFWKTTPVTNEVMDVGNYTMVAKKSGYGDTEFSFGISPGYTTQLNVRLNPTSFPLTLEAESMQGTGQQVTGGRKLVGTNDWYIFENFNLPEAGRIEFEVIAKAEWQVNGYWPKLEVAGPAQDIPSTDYASYFYYADFSQIGQWQVGIKQDEWTRNQGGHSIIVDKCIMRYVAVPPPNAPSNCVASFNHITGTISWIDNSSNEEGFRIEYQFGESPNWSSFTASANATSAQYTAGSPGNELYRFRVKAYVVSGAINSAYSNETLGKILGIPSNLAASAVSSSKINLSWTDNSSLEDGFKIERKPSGGNFTEIASTVANATSFSDSVGLSPNTTYYYRVRAYALSDGATPNVSVYSGEASTTTPSAVANLIRDPECAGPFYSWPSTDGWLMMDDEQTGTHDVSFSMSSPLSGSSSVLVYNNAATSAWTGVKQLMDLVQSHDYRVSFLVQAEQAGPFSALVEGLSTVDWQGQGAYHTYNVTNQRTVVSYQFNCRSTAQTIMAFQLGNIIGNVRMDSVSVIDLSSPPPSNPVLSVSSTNLNLGSASTGTLNGSFGISNTGGGTLSWTNTKDGNITVSPLNGTNNGTVNVSVVVDGVSVGTHTDHVYVSSNGGNATVNVSYTVNSPPSGGGLIVDSQFNGPFVADGTYGGWIKMEDTGSGVHQSSISNQNPLSGALSLLVYNDVATGSWTGAKQKIDLTQGHNYKVSFIVKSESAGPFNTFIDVLSTVDWIGQGGWYSYDVTSSRTVHTYQFNCRSTAPSYIAFHLGNVVGNSRLDSVVVTDLSLPKVVPSELEETTIPTSFHLYQNHPNPFNPITTIVFDIPEKSRASLSVYNLVGQQIVVLVDGDVEAGQHRVQWDTTANPSGVYLYELKTNSYRSIRKMAVVK